MPYTIYQASIPVFIRGLDNLSGILAKGAAFAAERGGDEVELVQARLAPDMFPLARQVQIACDVVKGAGGRLAGIEVPSHADTEVTFAELQARIRKTIEFLQTIDEGQLANAKTRAISFKAGPRELTFTGGTYLTEFAIPNLYFHSAIAYAILRQHGVELGKMDFLGAL